MPAKHAAYLITSQRGQPIFISVKLSFAFVRVKNSVERRITNFIGTSIGDKSNMDLPSLSSSAEKSRSKKRRNTRQMKSLVSVALICLLSTRLVYGQGNSISIPFLETAPVIDGRPGDEAGGLPWRSFSSIVKSDSNSQDVAARYKIAYGYSFLYVFIECNSDSIVHRDRAYQNGDGFHMVIAKPDSGRPTDEFYVLRFSPGDITKNIPAGRNEWYYNIGLSGKRLSPATKLVCRSDSGISYFELLLSWNDVYPYHPLFSEGIGLNMCFVKAIGEKEKNYYYLKYDDKIQDELSRRQYLNVIFEKPTAISEPVSFAMLERRNIETGDCVKLKVISLVKSQSGVSYYFTMSSADNYVFTDLYEEKQLAAGSNENEFDLPAEKLPPSGYVVNWRCSDSSEGQIPFSILPRMDYEKEKEVLDRLREKATVGSYNSLLFMLENLFDEYRRVKPYETAGQIREGYYSYRDYIAKLENGGDSLARMTGIFRRAFLSEIDTTLQPYTVKVPKDYTTGKKYPLLVMLHGSGSDDRDILSGTDLSEGNFVELAPYGRGTSNCFTTDGAEIDVKEAIDDVIRNYSIDTSKIVIAGFSMGGYGAYRIFYEYPTLFKGVAVFSGNPSLATRWIGEGFPDFLNDKYLKPFKGVPVFVYHSKNDLNCPYELTEQLVAKLRAVGARVEFVTSEVGGHGIIDKGNISKYYRWLKSIAKSIDARYAKPR